MECQICVHTSHAHNQTGNNAKCALPAFGFVYCLLFILSMFDLDADFASWSDPAKKVIQLCA